MGRDGGTRRLTESALLMAVSIVLFLGAFVPVLGILVAPFSPLPICVLTLKYGPRHGALVACVTLFVAALLFSVVMGGAFLPFAFIGLCQGTMARAGVSGARMLVIGALATMLVLFGLFAVYEHMASCDPNLATPGEFLEAKAGAIRRLVMSTAGLVFEDEAISGFVRGYLDTFERLARELLRFPLALFTMLGGLGFGMSFLVAGKVVGKLGFRFPEPPAPGELKGTGAAALFFVAVCLVTVYCMKVEALREWRIYCLNLLFLGLLYHVATGLSIVSRVLDACGVETMVRPVLYLLILRFLTFPPLPLLIVAAVSDPVVDWRRLVGGRSGGGTG